MMHNAAWTEHCRQHANVLYMLCAHIVIACVAVNPKPYLPARTA